MITNVDLYISQIIVQLAEALPPAGIRVLLEQIIIPLLRNEVMEKTLSPHLDSGTQLAINIERYSIAARRCLTTMTISSIGIFGHFLSLLRRVSRNGIASGYMDRILPICVQSMQLIVVSETDRGEKRELAEFFVRLFLEEINCIEYSNDRSPNKIGMSWITSTSDVRLRLESKFIIEQFYKCCVTSTMFRSVAFETDGLRDVLQCLLEKSIRLLADPGELNTDDGGDNYLSVDVSVRLNTRVEFFSLLLGTVQSSSTLNRYRMYFALSTRSLYIRNDQFDFGVF